MGVPAGQKLLYWLGQAARSVRETAGVSRAEIAVAVKRDQSAVERFENGQTMPQQLERVLAAYAAACNLDDPRDILQAALHLWYKHGTPPTLDPP